MTDGGATDAAARLAAIRERERRSEYAGAADDVRWLLDALAAERARVAELETERDEWKATAETLENKTALAAMVYSAHRQLESERARVAAVEGALAVYADPAFYEAQVVDAPATVNAEFVGPTPAMLDRGAAARAALAGGEGA